MARFTFGGFGGDAVSIDPTLSNGFFRAALSLNATGTFWSASTGGTQYTDLIDPNTSAALTGVSSSAKGQVVPFKGPNGVYEGWLDFGAGRFKVTATDAGLYGLGSIQTLLRNSMIYVTDPQWGMVADYNIGANTGTDNTAAFNTIIATAVATGRPIYVPEGHFGFSSQVNISAAKTLMISGAPSSVVGGMTQAYGAWFHYMGTSSGAIVTFADCQNVSWAGVGLNLRSQCDGFDITSDNSPISTRFRFSNFNMWQPVVGGNINTGGAGTQSDQMLIENVRIDGFVTAAFQTNSANVTGVHWLKCNTAAASTTSGTHYNFLRGGMLVVENCSAGYGQTFCNVALNASCVTLDTCQMEGSTSGSRAFLIVGANGDTGQLDTVVLRNCVPDNPVILAGPSRKILSQGNLWHSGANITVSGASSRFISYGEDVSLLTITVSGTNAMFRQMDSDLVTGGNAATGSAGVSGSTGITVTGNTYAGTIAFTTAAGLAVDAYAVVVGVTSQIGTGYRISLTPTNGAAAAAQAFVAGKLSSQWELHLHNPPAGATAMTFDYRLG